MTRSKYGRHSALLSCFPVTPSTHLLTVLCTPFFLQEIASFEFFNMIFFFSFFVWEKSMHRK